VKISDFHYDFPQELLALKPQEDSRLLSYDRKLGEIKHFKFKDIVSLLKPSDCLVVNNTKVIPARFFVKKITGGKLEGLYIKKTQRGVLVWLKGKVTEGNVIHLCHPDGSSCHPGLDPGPSPLKVLQKEEMRAELECDSSEFENYLWNKGVIPVPPYIRQERQRSGMEDTLQSDSENYQTVFSKDSKYFSAAAPTASLHFNDELMSSLKNEVLEINLQVGEGTFAPVRTENLNEHKMHSELVQIDPEVWSRIKKIKEEGRRIIAVGTTAVRSLESAFLRDQVGERIDEFETQLFIKPPYNFKIIDGMITNFHWPDSTLIVLVASFIEEGSSELKHKWKELYKAAIADKYRLFSYGDASLIL